MPSLVSIEVLWMPFKLNGSFVIWDGAGHRNSSKIENFSFSGRHGSQIIVSKPWSAGRFFWTLLLGLSLGTCISGNPLLQCWSHLCVFYSCITHTCFLHIHLHWMFFAPMTLRSSNIYVPACNTIILLKYWVASNHILLFILWWYWPLSASFWRGNQVF